MKLQKIGELIQSKKKTISHKVHKVIETNPEDWIIVENHHEPLIKKEDFEQVQDIVFNRDIRINKDNKYDIFSGHLKCEDCGNSLTNKKAKNNEYYYCTSFLKEKTCSNHAISKKNLLSDTLKMINSQIQLILEIDNQIENIISEKDINYDLEILNNRIKEIDNNISKYKRLQDIIKDDLACDYITREEYLEYKNEYNEFLKRFEYEKKQTIKKIENVGFKSNENMEWIEKFKHNTNLEELTKSVIDELIDDILVCDDGKIRIVFKYKDKYIQAIDFIKKHKCDIITQEIALTC